MIGMSTYLNLAFRIKELGKKLKILMFYLKNLSFWFRFSHLDYFNDGNMWTFWDTYEHMNWDRYF